MELRIPIGYQLGTQWVPTGTPVPAKYLVLAKYQGGIGYLFGTYGYLEGICYFIQRSKCRR